ncbi:hypothetical protein FZC33_27645 [Labrys sp. KNU-23]|uniref:hypothetical protein n=1 Tax=Labrys sp. KNU-23 TaxID=2789216 RepID=UPI0011EF240F|nr:hypothetical protein [Labrys sp. KNU-23]QEN89852.1 hypothetical protein FZC33_27645 [Labrys sp. KNU-23]
MELPLAAQSPFQRLRPPLTGLVLGVLPLWLFVGTSESFSVNGQFVSQSRFNILGLVLAGIGLAMMIKLLWNDGPWARRWLPRTALAVVAAAICLVQLAYSVGLVDLSRFLGSA